MYSNFYEIPLPALRFEKVEEINKSERHRRERRLLNRPHQRNKKRQKQHTTLVYSEGTQIHSQETTRKEHKRFQNNETQTEKERQ